MAALMVSAMARLSEALMLSALTRLSGALMRALPMPM